MPGSKRSWISNRKSQLLPGVQLTPLMKNLLEKPKRLVPPHLPLWLLFLVVCRTSMCMLEMSSYSWQPAELLPRYFCFPGPESESPSGRRRERSSECNPPKFLRSLNHQSTRKKESSLEPNIVKPGCKAGLVWPASGKQQHLALRSEQ